MSITKRSKQKDAILETLKNTKCHPTADWVYTEVRKSIPNISLGTVYRNLSKMSEEGIIKKLILGTSSEHFDGDISPHYHISCVDCNKIFDIHEKPVIDINKWASELFSGEIYEHYTVFAGKCSSCINKSN